jgi:hypothetical protein
MKIKNIHERKMGRSLQQVGELLNSLSADKDRLWPCESWLPIRTGAHGSEFFGFCLKIEGVKPAPEQSLS